MDCYYHSKDLQQFGDMGRNNRPMGKVHELLQRRVCRRRPDGTGKALIALGVAQAVRCPCCIDTILKPDLEKDRTSKR